MNNVFIDLKCTGCGGTVSIITNEGYFVCDYCGREYVTPEFVRSHKTIAEINAQELQRQIAKAQQDYYLYKMERLGQELRGWNGLKAVGRGVVMTVYSHNHNQTINVLNNKETGFAFANMNDADIDYALGHWEEITSSRWNSKEGLNEIHQALEDVKLKKDKRDSIIAEVEKQIKYNLQLIKKEAANV